MQEERPQLSVAFAAIFYGLMGAFALALTTWAWPSDIWFWHDNYETALSIDAVIGAAIGLVTVFATTMLERTTEWAKRLSAEFAKLLGPLDGYAVFVLAVASSFAEEMFFRGFLQQTLTQELFGGNIWLGLTVSSLVFGLVHIGPNWRTFWPWTAMAVVMGFVLGGAYIYTGNLLAPVIAHFTINFLNLSSIVDESTD